MAVTLPGLWGCPCVGATPGLQIRLSAEKEVTVEAPRQLLLMAVDVAAWSV